jgi:hypothetical protein
VVGEVQNTGTTTLGAIYVAGSAYDSTGQVLAQSESKVFGLNLAAGAKSPFYMDFPPESSPAYDLSWVSNVTSLAVNIYSVLPNSTSLNTDVVVPADNLQVVNSNAGNYTITGTALNAGSDPVSDVVLFASFYNSTGGVVGIGYLDLGASLQPAGSVTFTLTPVDDTAITSQIVSYSVSALGLPVTATATPTPAPTIAPTALPTSTATPIPTQPPASSQSNLITYIAIIVVGLVVAVALVLLILKDRKNKDLPPPPSPA